MEMYSRGRRGAPAKGVGRVTGARVQISPSPPEKSINLDTRLVLFSTKSVLRRDKSDSQMKSLRDEIAYGEYKTDLISSKSKTLISSKLVWISSCFARFHKKQNRRFAKQSFRAGQLRLALRNQIS